MRGAFPSIIKLIPKCEKIKKLTAICKLCKQNASFTFRTASKDCHLMIGGDNMYMPLCRECHARESKLNAENAYIGDPSKISVEIENAQFDEQKEDQEEGGQNNRLQVTPQASVNHEKKTPLSSVTGTTASGGSPKAKSFSSEDSLGKQNHGSGSAQQITLRRINNKTASTTP